MDYKMIRTVNKYLGTEWKQNGRDTDGIDCGGLVLKVLEENGVQVPDFEGEDIVTDNWEKENPEKLRELSEIVGDRVEIKESLVRETQPLDILLIEFANVAIHAGVVINNTQFLHIVKDKKVVSSKIRKWKNRISDVYRPKDGV